MVSNEGRYAASWTDRFGNRVEALAVPAWVVYGAIGLALALVQSALLLAAGGRAYLELVPVSVFNSFLIAFLLGLLHLLDRKAAVALRTMRPVLDLSGPEYAQYRYRMANMPLGASLVAGLTLLILVVLMETLVVTPVRYGGLEELPLFTVVYQIVDKGSAFLLGVFLYHTIRQLRLIQRMTTQQERISLFNPAPLQAFAPVTALTAVGLIVAVYGWLLINPDLLVDPVVIGFTAVMTGLALAVFVWPLHDSAPADEGGEGPDAAGC